MSRTVGPHITQLRLYPVFIWQALFQAPSHQRIEIKESQRFLFHFAD